MARRLAGSARVKLEFDVFRESFSWFQAADFLQMLYDRNVCEMTAGILSACNLGFCAIES